jgi:hypothetical protein
MVLSFLLFFLHFALDIAASGLYWWSTTASGTPSLSTGVSVGTGFTFLLLLQGAGAIQVMRQGLGVIVGSARVWVSCFFFIQFLGETFFTVFLVWMAQHASVTNAAPVFVASFALFTVAYFVAILQVFLWIFGGTPDDRK